MKVLVILGSVREGRQGIKAARYIENLLKAKGHEAVLIDPIEYDFPLLKVPYRYQADNAPESMKGLASHIKEADGFVIVTAEYNHLPPAALTNLLDHYLPEWGFRPSAIVSYSAGPFGGVRAASHLRDMLSELGMPSIPTSIPITAVQEFSDDGKPNRPELYEKTGEKFLAEFEWYMQAMKAQREKGLPY